jgi:hypothetical protein
MSAPSACDRLLLFDSGCVWGRFADATSITLHAGAATCTIALPDGSRQSHSLLHARHEHRPLLVLLLRFRNMFCSLPPVVDPSFVPDAIFTVRMLKHVLMILIYAHLCVCECVCVNVLVYVCVCEYACACRVKAGYLFIHSSFFDELHRVVKHCVTCVFLHLDILCTPNKFVCPTWMAPPSCHHWTAILPCLWPQMASFSAFSFLFKPTSEL